MKKESTKLSEVKTNGEAAADPIIEEMGRTMVIQPDDFDDGVPPSPLEEIMDYLEEAALGGSMGRVTAEMPSIIVRDGAGEALIAQLSRLKLCTERAYAIAVEAHQAAKR